MAIAHLETGRPSGILLSRSGEMSPSPQRIEIPLRNELVRISGEGRGMDLRYDLRDLGLIPGIDGYRDYEVHAFERMVAKAAEEGEDCTIYGPLVNDLILPSDSFNGDPAFPETSGEFAGLTKWDMFKLVGNRLVEVFEVKTAPEFMNEYGQKVDEETGFPALLERVKYDFGSRIKKVVGGFTHVSNDIAIDPHRVRIRFISPTSQKGRLAFDRPITPHEQIEPTPEIAEALIRTEARRRARYEAKKEKAELIAKQAKQAA